MWNKSRSKGIFNLLKIELRIKKSMLWVNFISRKYYSIMKRAGKQTKQTTDKHKLLNLIVSMAYVAWNTCSWLCANILCEKKGCNKKKTFTKNFMEVTNFSNNLESFLLTFHYLLFIVLLLLICVGWKAYETIDQKNFKAETMMTNMYWILDFAACELFLRDKNIQ